MLAGKLYTVEQEQTAGETGTYQVLWNASHPVFEGHFPGRPVVPGVCMMQTIQELLEKLLDKKVVLKKAASQKFLNMIDPNAHPRVEIGVQYKLQDGEIKVTASLKHEAITFMKFQGTFVSA
ncbi:3-hydroxyacyl-ACP dehydratase [Chitinophaga rhizophila]|uniref:3-hydroxyacyl-ACP dehydratase n=1 Tax=Chitinophaga rhizophila TaxID=2866212 RepID=A0ABS7G8T2_9BACT|nr:3-hydroxyacyl-ACP dehydratase [Chitinophaga rhizophila]MBW8684071.1 3-hydroxyacyl-ACP dehydratase [Chitinophaga rhizophila]